MIPRIENSFSIGVEHNGSGVVVTLGGHVGLLVKDVPLDSVGVVLNVMLPVDLGDVEITVLLI